MVFKIFQVFLLASLKYILTVPYALLIGIEYEYALPAIVIGGIGGFLFFYYLNKRVVRFFRKLIPATCSLMPGGIRTRCHHLFASWFEKRSKPIFSRRNRMIIRLKKNYGFWGIVITTPVLLSIPVGAFLASHYYSKDKRVVIYMVISIIGWGVILSSALLLFPGIIH